MTSLWRPFSTPGAQAATIIESGSGAYVVDNQGRRYLDAAGGLWNLSLGLNNGKLVSDLHRQLQTLSFASLFDASHGPAEALSERLVGMSGGTMSHVYLSTTGSSAVEVAIRAARLYHRARRQPARRRILSFDLAYHGGSTMSLAASGILAQEVSEAGDMLPDFQHVPSPRDEAASLAAMKALLSGGDAQYVAALIMEPILGSAGVIVPSAGYCRELSRLCADAGVLLIADEVATGAGRCGAMFASSLLELQPDIIALSKGLNAGYCPLGATMFSPRVVEPIVQAGITLQSGSTQDGNPLGCVAALATLDALEQQALFLRASHVGALVRERLGALAGTSVVSEVRGRGLMIGIELAHQDSGGTAFSAEEALRVRQLCKDAGVLVYHFSSGISLFPPLTISDDEAAEMVDIVTEVLMTLI